jgi:hypothetical protein
VNDFKSENDLCQEPLGLLFNGDPRVGLSAFVALLIVRRGEPMGVRVEGGGFTTYESARLAGRRALADFLEQVELESFRPD